MPFNRLCETCNKPFVTPYAKPKGRFCSSLCFGVWVSQNRTGPSSHNWRGGITRRKQDGRTLIKAHGHPRGHFGYVYEYILIAEQALGHYLPQNAVVHHVDENPTNNKNENLVICQDNAYHKLLHKRTRIVNAGGDPDKDKICPDCQTLKSQYEFHRNRGTGDGLAGICNLCVARRDAVRRYKKKENSMRTDLRCT